MAKAILGKVFGALVASATVVATTAQMAVAQGFVGDFAPDQWELFNSSPRVEGDNADVTINGIPLAPFNGSVDFTNAPDSLTLLGSNQSAILDEFGLDCESVNPFFLFLCESSFTTVFVTVPEASLLTFDWNYNTSDRSTTQASGPAFDPFGFAVAMFPPGTPMADGDFIELIDRSGPFEQSGTTSVAVEANQIFGFQIGTADNQGGRAMAIVSQFQVTAIEPDEPTSVPEPAAVVGLVVAGLGLRLCKKSRP